MRVTKRIEHHIRMGEYESLTLAASVDLEVPEGARKDDVLDDIDDLIRSALDPDLRQARKLADNASYIKDWRN